MIGEAQVNGTIQVICSHIRNTLDLINIFIQRLRSERCLRPYQINEECEKSKMSNFNLGFVDQVFVLVTTEVEDKETNVSDTLISIVDTVKMLLSAKMGIEQGEALLKDVCALYRTATNYCRHFSKVNRHDVHIRRNK